MRVSRWLGGISMAALLAATTIGAAGPAIARGEGPSIGRAAPKNFNISKAPGNQSEDAVAFNQTNPLQLTVVSNEESISGLFHGWSTDGGKTWSTDVIADND